NERAPTALFASVWPIGTFQWQLSDRPSRADAPRFQPPLHQSFRSGFGKASEHLRVLSLPYPREPVSTDLRLSFSTFRRPHPPLWPSSLLVRTLAFAALGF